PGHHRSARRCGRRPGLMTAAALFFKGVGGGEGLPYIHEYLLSLDGHGSWQDLQAMPRPVLSYWLAYRNVRLQVERAARE
ncbi:MAG: hypothetical protein ACR2JY_17700, partial [Chloroflexota bacterium]